MFIAEELVAQGGPSAPVWAFLTAITIGILGIIGQQMSAKRAANEAKLEAGKAAKNSQEANTNTTSLANGFASSVNDKLNRIMRKQDQLDDRFTKHLEWHVDNPKDK